MRKVTVNEVLKKSHIELNTHIVIFAENRERLLSNFGEVICEEINLK